MSPYLKITFRTFTIWILASIINGGLCATCKSLINHTPGDLPADALLILFVSLFFSAPGFLILWLVLLIKLGNGVYERALFRAALSAAFILAAVTALIAWPAIKPEFPNRYVFVLLIVVSAITSIMMHFNHFKKINN